MDTTLLTLSGLLITATGFGVVTQCLIGGVFMLFLGCAMGVTAVVINRKGSK
jgi:hypothetical protein